MAQSFGHIQVSIVKLRDYCLSETHPRGRHKARVFRSRLGLTAADAVILQQALIEAAEAGQDELKPAGADDYGQLFRLDFAMTTNAGAAVIRSAWIMMPGESVLKFVTCYVL
jgi:hypothetical protein